jgi:hypothetical protein
LALKNAFHQQVLDKQSWPLEKHSYSYSYLYLWQQQLDGLFWIKVKEVKEVVKEVEMEMKVEMEVEVEMRDV